MAVMAAKGLACLTLSRLVVILTGKVKKVIYVDRVSIINTSYDANGSTNLLSFREIKFISIAEDFKKSLNELEQKSGCGWTLIYFLRGKH